MDADGVDIWRIEVARVGIGDDALAVLADGEREQAERFRFQKDRTRYLASHVAVRRILAGYAACEARHLLFHEGANGKPELEGSSVHYNLTHTDDLALLAVGFSEPVGIDVEKERVVPEALDIAARMFSERERRLLAEASEEERSPVFLRIWTAKEAIVKATGEGLGGELQSFDTTAVLEGEPAVVALKSMWVVRGIDPGSGYFGAVARCEALERVEIRNWQGL